MYDVIVIGSGPAGISASIYLKRAQKNVCIITDGNSALKRTNKIENYYGVMSISGEDLYNVGIKQAEELEIPMVKDEVTNISFEKHFIVRTVNSEYETKYVVIATGTNRAAPKVKGIKEFEGKGISYCAICDGFFYKDKNVAVVGSGNYAIHEAETLKLIANSVTILTNGQKMIENRNASDFEVDETPIREFRGDNVIKEVEFENNSTKAIDGVFIAIGTASSVDLARKIGAVIKANNIVTNENMQTTVRGLYACGDCTGGLLQVNKAVYEGAVAALDIIKNLNLNNE
jgi:thioredoxin reductase (NADPH)